MPAVTVPVPPMGPKDSPARRKARQALVDVLWTPEGQRRLPTGKALGAALAACKGEDAWWVCEASSAGPLYFLPTREWVAQLAKWVDGTGAKKVLEVGAGDGFLASCLKSVRPKLRVLASDDHSWTKPAKRMNAQDRSDFAGIAFAGIPAMDHVEKLAAVAAVEKHRPDLIIMAWPPPGPLVEKVIKTPAAKLILEIAVDGDVCGNPERSWRYRKEFLDGPLEDKGWCRLDDGRSPLRTRVTLYYGRAHAEHGLE